MPLSMYDEHIEPVTVEAPKENNAGNFPRLKKADISLQILYAYEDLEQNCVLD